MMNLLFHPYYVCNSLKLHLLVLHDWCLLDCFDLFYVTQVQAPDLLLLDEPLAGLGMQMHIVTAFSFFVFLDSLPSFQILLNAVNRV